MALLVARHLSDFFNTFYHDTKSSQPIERPFLTHHVCGDLFAKHMGYENFKALLSLDTMPINVEGLVSFLSDLENRGFVITRSPIQLIWPKKIKFTSPERKALWQDQLYRVKSEVPFTDVLGLVEPIILPDGKGKWDIDPKNKFDRRWFVAVLGEEFVSDTKGRNEGFQHLKERALDNDPEAVHPYALWLMDDNQYQQGLSMLHSAASKGNADAHAELGRIYATGEGVDEDLIMAKHHYEMAAASNHNQALHALGALYEYKGKLETDVALSFAYHLRAAEAGNHTSMGCVAKQYFHGFGVDKDVDKALHYAHMGAKCLDGCSLQVLGENAGHVKGDWDKAFGYFTASALVGDEEGLHFAGWCLLTGNGTKRDIDKACKYLAEAADMGHINSMFMLGAFLCDDLNLNKNYTLSLHWLRKAAERDHAFALVILGKLHLTPEAEVLDYQNAHSCFLKACKLKYHQAFSFLSECYRLGLGIDPDYKLAFTFMVEAAELGSKNAMKLVSQYYAEGFGTEMNDYQADIWLKKYQNCIENKPYHYVDQVYADAPGYVVDAGEEQ
ncbi:SEL1-like repeat protein [Yersinia rochesterensis]|uniref:tetratricopeptide repeat protein n=1 Tax=Yersinia TaxID=629 RepID=UPI00223F52B5|nr:MULTISPECIES: SEL1-like repeat protein [Yersinia]MDA5543832.1 SEL1-like repeat protein [Yersinia rochesterensis]UZM74463.1 SEL1-like repeat protein [Yersinia sp. SCPM-O-B-9106 (C-191)]